MIAPAHSFVERSETELRGRKVRASDSSVAGNTRPSRDEDQSHRDESTRCFALRSKTAGGVKRGNLYAEQGQIGKESEKSGTCGWTGTRRLVSSLLPGRPHEAVSNAGPRWIIIAPALVLRSKTAGVQNPAYRSASMS